MAIRPLDRQEYLATCRGKMTDVTEAGDATVDIWPYAAEARLGTEMSEHAVEQQLVECVYRSGDGRHDHVLIPYGIRNVFLILIVDRIEQCVHGHYLLDLNEEYGVEYGET
jgi:hypothetical protein